MVFKSYLTEDERSFMSEIGAISLDIDKAYTMLEMVDLRLETQFKEVEQKVLMESGTTDDIEFLFTEANEEAAEKKKGIVGTIVEAVGNLFRKISNFIKEKILKLPVDKSSVVEIDQSDIDNYNSIKTTFGAVEGGLNSIKDGMKEHPWISGGAIVAGTAIAILGAYKLREASGKKVKKSAGEVQQMAEEVENKVNKPVQALIDRISSFTNSDSGIIGKILAPIRSFGSAVSKFISSLPAKLTGHSKGEEVKNEENASEPAQSEQAGKPEPKPEPKPGKGGKGNGGKGTTGSGKQETTSTTTGKETEAPAEPKMTKDDAKKAAHDERAAKRQAAINKLAKDEGISYDEALEKYDAESKKNRRLNEMKETFTNSPANNDAEKEAVAKGNIETTKERLKTRENIDKLQTKRGEKYEKDNAMNELRKLLDITSGKGKKRKGKIATALSKNRFKPGKNRKNVYFKQDGKWYKYVLSNSGGYDDAPEKWTTSSGATFVSDKKEQPAFESVTEMETILPSDVIIGMMESDENFETVLCELVLEESVEEFFITIDDEVFVEYVEMAEDLRDAGAFMESENSLLGYDPSIELSIYEESALNEEVNALLKAFNDL